MKLRYQGLILIGVPLLCQFVFVWLLVSINGSLESAAANEARAKQIIAKSDELNFTNSESYARLLALRLTGSSSRSLEQSYSATRASQLQKASELEQLVRDDLRSKSIVQTYTEAIRKLSKLIDEANEAYSKNLPDGFGEEPTYTQFISQSEFLEEARYYLNVAAVQSRKLREINSPIIQEFQPEAARKRAVLKIVVQAGVIGNASISVALAILFSMNTIKRLDTLMWNIKAFSDGKLNLKPLGGKDELADLDERFRNMAYARNAAEEMRRSITGMVSHDMRTPLTAISGTLTLALEKVYGEMTPKLEKMLMRTNSDVQRLIRLSNDLLDSEKIESGKIDLVLEDHFVESLAHQSFSAVQTLLDEKSLKLKAEIPDELMIQCDGDRIIQVLVNFLSNASKFSPNDATVYLRATASTKSIRISVADEGPGISAEDCLVVFDKFKQLAQPSSTRRAGSGLGLAICKALVEKHGGTIGVESEVGRGSEFWFELPVHKGEDLNQSFKSETTG